MGTSNTNGGWARILRFCSVGAVSSALYFVLASMITYLFPDHEVTASVTAYSACIGFSFIFQKYFAFRSTRPFKFELAKFTVVSLLGLSLSTGIVYVAVTSFGISAYGSYMIVVATVPFLSYILFSRFVFD
ncbi:MAG: putative flippase GtrA [Lysobacterales bacterium]|jgi:putative flippase GtrA